MMQSSGIKKILFNISYFFKNLFDKYAKATKFRKRDVFAYFIIGLLICSSAIFLGGTIKLSTCKEYDYIAYNNELETLKNNTNLINYSFKCDKEELPTCDKFVTNTFGIEIGPYSFNHSIYCYATLDNEKTGSISYNDKEVTKNSELLFISNLGFFFDINCKVIDNTGFKYKEPYFKASVSESLGRKILNLPENQELKPEMLAKTMIKVSYGGTDYNALIYSFIPNKESTYRSIFSDDILCIHDTEQKAHTFTRTICMPCGRYRNADMLRRYVEKGYSYDKFETYVMCSNNKTIYDNKATANKLFNAKTMYNYLLWIATTGILIVLALTIFLKKSPINCFLFGLGFFGIFEIIKLLVVKYTKTTSIILFSSSSLYAFSLIAICFLITFIIYKMRVGNKYENERKK